MGIKVSHPGGRFYDRPPVNVVEAESRRGRRFETTAGILDLRRMRTVLQ